MKTREIKFRTWNGSEMIYLKNSGLQYFDFEGSYSLGFTVDAYSAFWAHEHYQKMTDEAGKFPIMEYTGLKDKNGVDIYEGDIVDKGRGEIFYNELKAKFQVKWHDKVFKRVRGESPNYNNGEDLFMNSQIAWEVIGNIYQNPELL